MNEELLFAREDLAVSQRVVQNLCCLLAEARHHCRGQALECCRSFNCVGPNCEPQCCGHKTDLADRIGFALKMLEPCDPGESGVA